VIYDFLMIGCYERICELNGSFDDQFGQHLQSEKNIYNAINEAKA